MDALIGDAIRRVLRNLSCAIAAHGSYVALPLRVSSPSTSMASTLRFNSVALVSPSGAVLPIGLALEISWSIAVLNPRRRCSIASPSSPWLVGPNDVGELVAVGIGLIVGVRGGVDDRS